MNKITALIINGGVALALTAHAADSAHLKLYSVNGKYDDVKQDVALTIENRGFQLERTLHIGDMLDRTGKDLGATKKIYDRAEALQFCPATVSRKAMEADASNIVFCPYTIVIYSLPTDPKKIYVGYRRPQPVGSADSRAALKAVDGLLDDIAREALNIKK